MPLITVRALGPVAVSIGGVPAPRELLWRKHLALLLYLLRSPRRTRERDHLIGLLWADSPEAKARQSLNEALRLLRHHCGQEVVDTPRGTEQVRLGGEFSLDLDEFDVAYSAEDWAGAADLAAGEFAEGFTVRGASAVEDWLGAERRQFRERGVEALVRQAESLLAGGATARATLLAERALALDGLSERAARAVMRSRLLAGDRRGAAECGERFVKRMRDELGSEASAELRQLAALAAAVPNEPRSGRITAQAERTPFLGREAELTQLLDAWALCRATRSATLCVVNGDPGSGISRLLEEVSARAALDGASVAGLRAVDADQDHAQSLISGLATGGLHGLPGVAAASPAALAAFAGRFPAWAERYAGAGGPAMELEAALADVIRATAEERPLLLIIDDAHRLDGTSLRMLPRLLREVAALPVMVLLGVSTDAVSPELDELRRMVGQVPGVRLAISALPTLALRSLAAELLPTYTAVELDRLVRRVSSDSAGLALLAVEILRAVSRGMELDRDGKAWPDVAQTLDQTLPSELPDTVVVALRINARRLSKSALEVLAAAALAPDRMTPDLLAHATELDRRTVDEALDELEWHRWLVAEGRGYSFVARLVRRVLSRDLLTPGQRRRLLARIEGWPGDPLA